MHDHLRPVRLFGKDYQWHARPGQPLQLAPATPWPELPEVHNVLLMMAEQVALAWLPSSVSMMTSGRTP